MTVTPFFSIIVPYFESNKTINQTLLSILTQVYSDYEIIVIDDGSSNEFSAVSSISKFIKDQLIILEQPNGGPAVARNNGIRNSSGKYCAFLDSDDIWDPFYLLNIHKYLSNTQSPYAYGNYRVFTRTPLKSVQGQQERYRLFRNSFYRLLIFDFIPMSSSVVLSELAKKIKFNPEYSPSEDWAYWILIVKERKENINKVHNAICYYREHTLGISKSKSNHQKTSDKVRDMFINGDTIPFYVRYLMHWESDKSKILTLLSTRNYLKATSLYLCLVLRYFYFPPFYYFLFVAVWRKFSTLYVQSR
jgi:glycosyltransferase involved in cell wall biosynthesis